MSTIILMGTVVVGAICARHLVGYAMEGEPDVAMPARTLATLGVVLVTVPFLSGWVLVTVLVVEFLAMAVSDHLTGWNWIRIASRYHTRRDDEHKEALEQQRQTFILWAEAAIADARAQATCEATAQAMSTVAYMNRQLR